ncbi:MAG: response regulator transcription factor [Proteobacteria bacterium]|jgi:two-component system phosphate regulon response regulator PhoB|nr:response regulator transcription factor [Pseudomonadota bacterium]
MPMEKILVVEDEADLVELIRYNLAKEGFQVRDAGTGEAALRLATAEPFDVVLLDLMLPGIDGLEVCRRLKADPRTGRLPIIMVTAKGEDADVVAGLSLGADDYVAKPFSPKVLVARVRAVLRRIEAASGPQPEILVVGEISISKERREVLVRGRPAGLTTREFDLLALLAHRRGWVFTRGQIVDAVCGEDRDVTDRAVDVQIVGLRRKLGTAGKLVETVRGIGYRLKD